MSPPNLKHKRILVVEDDEMSYLYLNQLMIIAGILMDREKTGIDAIEKYRNNQNYDLILMDIQLPDMDGKQVTREIRKIDPGITIIAQTASRSSFEKELITEAGCTDVITKPYSMEELFEMLGKYI